MIEMCVPNKNIKEKYQESAITHTHTHIILGGFWGC